MKKIFTSIVFTVFFKFLSYGQDEPLVLLPTCHNVQTPFNKVKVIDKRIENQTLGFVQVGALNRVAQVKYPGNLSDSLAYFFASKNTALGKGQELTIILNELYLSEKTEATSETGRLKISMRLFGSNSPDQFTELFSIDSVYAFKGLDVTKKLLRSVSEHLCEIKTKAAVKNSLTVSGREIYSLADLQQLENLEKQKLAVYQANTVSPGIYMSYDQFKNNAPDNSTVTIDRSNLNNIKVYKWDSAKKKKSRIDNKTVYAVSDGTIVLKATTIGFYELKKIDNDFYYMGQTSFSNTSHAAMWGAAFGVVGAVIATEAEKNSQLYEFRINYLKGNSVLISRISK